MLSRVHDVREIANKFLADVIDVTRSVQPDPQRPSDFMQGHAELKTLFNTYRLSSYSPHGSQPAGAPAECASLGTVVFHDPLNDITIMGSRSDRTLLDISRHVHHREYTDAISVARRELAEAKPDAVKLAQAKLSDLVARAAKWGITIDAVPMAPSVKAAPVSPPASGPVQAMHVIPAATAAAAPAVSVKSVHEDMLGLPIVFIHNPGEGSAGMTTVPGTVTRVWDNGQIRLQMFPDDHDVQHKPKVHRRGADAGGGRVHIHGCWDLAPWYATLISRLCALEQSLAAIDALATENKQLSDRLTALETASSKPRRGRPAKPEGGNEAEAGELPSELEPAGREPDLIEGA
jgi:hypothetical protein